MQLVLSVKQDGFISGVEDINYIEIQIWYLNVSNLKHKVIKYSKLKKKCSITGPDWDQNSSLTFVVFTGPIN